MNLLPLDNFLFIKNNVFFTKMFLKNIAILKELLSNSKR